MVKKEISIDRKREVRNTVKKFLEDYPFIDKSPLNDSIELVEKLGIFILIDFAPDQISGFCKTIGEKDTFIFINNQMTLGRQIYSLWHEVYHWYTGEGNDISIQGSDQYEEVELAADYFASLILIKDELLKEKLISYGIGKSNCKYIKYDQIIDLQQYFKVSYSAMVLKLVDYFSENDIKKRLALANKERAKELKEKTINLGYDTSLLESTSDIYVSPELFDLLEKAISMQRISNDKAQKFIEFLEKGNES